MEIMSRLRKIVGMRTVYAFMNISSFLFFFCFLVSNKKKLLCTFYLTLSWKICLWENNSHSKWYSHEKIMWKRRSMHQQLQSLREWQFDICRSRELQGLKLPHLRPLLSRRNHRAPRLWLRHFQPFQHKSGISETSGMFLESVKVHPCCRVLWVLMRCELSVDRVSVW